MWILELKGLKLLKLHRKKAKQGLNRTKELNSGTPAKKAAC